MYLTVASNTKKLDSGILKALKLVSNPSLDLKQISHFIILTKGYAQIVLHRHRGGRI
jgi:hypothetical protein